MSPQPRIGSLFSGYGGLSMAVEAVFGGDTAWHCEIEPAPSKILAARWPGVPNLGDITKVDWSQVEPVDILDGGSPCQDVSAAGKRAGMRAGTRSGLWASMCDAIEYLRPSAVVWENVRGVLSAEADSALEPCAGCVGDGDDGAVLRALGRVLGDLSDLGYDAGWYGLRAADVGAPHGRFRVFVVAADTQHPERSGIRNPARSSFGHDGGALVASDTGSGPLEGSTSTGHGLSVATERGDRATSDADSPRLEGDGAVTVGAQLSDAVRGRQSSPDPLGLRGERRRGHGDVAGATRGREADRSERERGGDAAVNRGAADLGIDWGQYGPAIRRWESVLGRTAPAPTELAPKGGQRLSPRFVEFMMGLPAGWVTDIPISRNDQLKALGNGVVPQQAAEALRRLLPLVATEAAA